MRYLEKNKNREIEECTSARRKLSWTKVSIQCMSIRKRGGSFPRLSNLPEVDETLSQMEEIFELRLRRT